MKRIATAIVLTCIVSVLTSSLGAQANSLLPTDSSQAMSDPVREANLQALKTEVQIFKDFTQHILTTVYFSLGTVVVVLIAMVGFGWYQNVRVYERDKEVMRQALLNALNEQLSEKVRELEKKTTDRYLAFDSRMATALEHSLQRLNDFHLELEFSIFRATHTEKTPRTDFMVLFHQVSQAMGKVSPDVLNHALTVMLDYLETAPRIDPPTRTSLLALASELPAGSAVFSERIREVLAKKPE